MAPKKKGTVKKKKGPTIPMTPFDYNPPTIYELGVKPSLFVRARICCTALNHLNFEWPAVPTELALGAIKEAVVKRHGGALPGLRLYKDVVHPENCLSELPDSATLKELGIEGVLMEEGATLPSVTFHYDFQAPRFDDPIVAVEPEPLESKHDVPLKLYRKLTSPQHAARGPGAPGAGPHGPKNGHSLGGGVGVGREHGTPASAGPGWRQHLHPPGKAAPATATAGEPPAAGG
ncbi:hypothetical protein HYH03_005044 [Edaphochlamys debaryana]|uniref:Uncharacterized protein n=1 Tax=Edaphochlamys debaryana TaxID=47281 RepID=A0A835Y644_9CHLO|nr:hypothetical protein HYH03_005044 [Edaphochlamys debaryana]|eukprot:KAG2497042.1 hypothetical protein HYH03_005044 [Edaphochlamys debaryana]